MDHPSGDEWMKCECKTFRSAARSVRGCFERSLRVYTVRRALAEDLDIYGLKEQNS